MPLWSLKEVTVSLQLKEETNSDGQNKTGRRPKKMKTSEISLRSAEDYT